MACFDGNGVYQWSGTYGGPESEGLSQLSCTTTSSAWQATSARRPTLDLGPATQNFTALAQTDPFFACYDLSGLAMGTAEGLHIAGSFGVYPNPANDVVTLRGHVGTNTPVEVFDALGQRVISTTANTIDVERMERRHLLREVGRPHPTHNCSTLICMKHFATILALVVRAALSAQTPTSIQHFPTHEFAMMEFHSSPLGGYLATVTVWDSIDVDPGPGAIWLGTEHRRRGGSRGGLR